MLPMGQAQPRRPPAGHFHLPQIMPTTQLPHLLANPATALQNVGRRACCTPAARGRQHGGQLGGLLVGEHARRYTEVVPRRGIDAEYAVVPLDNVQVHLEDRKSTRLNSSHVRISYAVFCLKKKKKTKTRINTIR